MTSELDVTYHSNYVTRDFLFCDVSGNLPSQEGTIFYIYFCREVVAFCKLSAICCTFNRNITFTITFTKIRLGRQNGQKDDDNVCIFSDSLLPSPHPPFFRSFLWSCSEPSGELKVLVPSSDMTSEAGS